MSDVQVSARGESRNQDGGRLGPDKVPLTDTNFALHRVDAILLQVSRDDDGFSLLRPIDCGPH